MSGASPHDRALVKRLLRGEERAYEEFFDQHVRRLYRFALARLRGDADAAEEVVQRTLMSFLGSLRLFRGDAALYTWLCSLCLREVGAEVRAARRLRTRFAAAEPEVFARALARLAEPGDDPERRASRFEVAARVQRTLDALPERYGSALGWMYLEDLSVKEVGARLAIGPIAAQSLLARARQAFREAYAGDAEDDTSPPSQI